MNKFFCIFALSFFTYESFANSFRIKDAEGTIFKTIGSDTHLAKKGELLSKNWDLVLEQNAHLTLIDDNNNLMHLSKGSSLVYKNEKLLLRSGELWFQMYQTEKPLKIETMNALIEANSGEGILSFLLDKNKTQLISISGPIEIANKKNSKLNSTVTEGQFTFIDNDFEEGKPRNNTPVGKKTFDEMVSLFKKVKTMDSKSTEKFSHNQKIESENTVLKDDVLDKYKSELLSHDDKPIVHEIPKLPSQVKKKVAHKSKNSNIVKIFGIVKFSDRKPASTNEVKIETEKKLELDQSQEIKSNTYHESENLIDQLKKL